MTKDELAAIEARLKAATPGPWVYDFPLVGKYNESHFYDALCDIDDSVVGDIVGRANCYLIAYAPADIAALLAEVRRLQSELASHQPLRIVSDQCSAPYVDVIDNLASFAEWAAEDGPALDAEALPVESEGGEID